MGAPSLFYAYIKYRGQVPYINQVGQPKRATWEHRLLPSPLRRLASYGYYTRSRRLANIVIGVIIWRRLIIVNYRFFFTREICFIILFSAENGFGGIAKRFRRPVGREPRERRRRSEFCFPRGRAANTRRQSCCGKTPFGRFGGEKKQKKRNQKPAQTRLRVTFCRRKNFGLVVVFEIVTAREKALSTCGPRGLTATVAVFLVRSRTQGGGDDGLRIFPAVAFLRNLRQRVPWFFAVGPPASRPDRRPACAARFRLLPPGLRHRISWSRDRQRHLAWFWYFLLAPCWCG